MKDKQNKFLFWKKIFQNEISVLILRIFILYIIITITQIVFYFYNQEIIGNLTFKDAFRLVKGALIFDSISVLYINSLFIVLSALPFHFRTNQTYQKFLFWLYTITNSLTIVILNLADVIYFHYAQKRFTFEEIHYTKNDNALSLMNVFFIENFWILFVALFLIFGMIVIYKKIRIIPIKIQRPIAYYLTQAFIFLIILFLSFGGMRGGFRPKLRPYNLCNASNYTATPQEANLILSNPFCALRTIQIQKLEDPGYFNEDELEKIYSPYHFPKQSLSHNLGKRNIVVFILESFSKEHSKFYCSELYQNESGYTPFLDSLMKESYTFVNAFSNGTRSIEALPSILSSIPSYEKPFVMLPQSLGEMEGLPTILNQEGYVSSFFCGTEKNSMFFQAYTSMAGIKTFYARDDYENECIVNSNTVEPYWGVFDMPFYQYMASKIKRMPQPFFVSVFNLTSHHPYTLPSDYVNKMPKGHTLVQPCVAYTDLSLRKFFEKVENEPWYKNTIFVFVADHVSPEMYAKQTRLPKGHTAIFYFIYTPDKVLQGLDSQVTQQLDIMPTLLGIIGYKKPYFAFGRDVFNEPERFPMATSYINEIYQCITDSVSIYFNEKRIISAYTANDIFQKKNIVKQKSKKQEDALLQLKAILQSYYFQLNKKKYIVPKN